MKIAAINGSPRGKGSNTAKMLEHIFAGAQAYGAETLQVNLSERQIEHCTGCYRCWSATPGLCHIQDDMRGVMASLGGAQVIILGTPIYFGNVPGLFKDFIDRLTSAGNPHTGLHEEYVPLTPPKFLVLSSCGHPDRGQFEVLALWMKHFFRMLQTQPAGEIYLTGGKRLTTHPDETTPRLQELLHRVGEQLARDGVLEDALLAELAQI